MTTGTFLGRVDEDADRREALFGGVGAVKVWNLLGKFAMRPFSAVLLCELEPGASVGPHAQQRDPEIVIVLEGQGEAVVAGVARTLAPGVVVHVPFKKRLSLSNGSATEPLRYLIVKAVEAPPPGPPVTNT